MVRLKLNIVIVNVNVIVIVNVIVVTSSKHPHDSCAFTFVLLEAIYLFQHNTRFKKLFSYPIVYSGNLDYDTNAV
jgi:hypothetical protein